MSQRVFVYGTLRRGESNHFLLENSEFLGDYMTEDRFNLFSLGPYPAAIEGNSPLIGEVYLVDDATLAKLDIVEDYPIEYDRKLIPTSFGDAWIYLYQDKSELTKQLSSGDWCQREENYK
ncbi:MAG: gamma-glutamylcyclotransferase [Vibrio sp.]